MTSSDGIFNLKKRLHKIHFWINIFNSIFSLKSNFKNFFIFSYGILDMDIKHKNWIFLKLWQNVYIKIDYNQQKIGIRIPFDLSLSNTLIFIKSILKSCLKFSNGILDIDYCEQKIGISIPFELSLSNTLIFIKVNYKKLLKIQQWDLRYGYQKQKQNFLKLWQHVYIKIDYWKQKIGIRFPFELSLSNCLILIKVNLKKLLKIQLRDFRFGKIKARN